MNKSEKFETNCIRIQAGRSQHKEHSVPVYQTSSFVFSNAEEARDVFAEIAEGHIYTRYSNPNSDEFIQKLCALEGAEDGIATSSGMAAVFLSMIAILQPGDHLLAPKQLFGTTYLLITNVLSRWGISHTFVDCRDTASWEKHILPTTKMIYAETPSNPGLELIDLKWMCRLAEKHGLYVVIDNCFATPYIQNPLKYGADLVIHSATKFIDGQGRTISGAVLGSRESIKDVKLLARIIGPTMSPYTAWLLSKSLETLAVRMERHCSNALALAQYLEKNKEVEWVRYPFLPSHPQYKLAKKQMKLGGGLVSFELKGGIKRSMKFINALKLLSLTPNLGDSRTTITHPTTTTHSKLTSEERKESGVTDGMIRIAVGLEHIDDIIADIEQAIKKT
ncbi:MAG: aminotransferase class I/II-fold pyridoxal phosphate-dependent enzyme [Bacteroidales bacterium]|nr:aminotransferase class I/II-fold pyridoxal phosphate-dependent enzyme [Bacteroidales bacterium]MBN2764353.1 aminotransferase class I/II-fold pyridoxal phosphate-dependent enzyme [Bacteroidales bacterium]